MATSSVRTGGTAISMGRMTEHSVPSYIKPTDTRNVSAGGVVLLQGRYVSGQKGNEVVVSVNAGAVERKLAIREMNQLIDGRAVEGSSFAIKGRG